MTPQKPNGQDPNGQQPDTVWRNRFIMINLAGIAGTAVALIGLAIWYSDLLVEGGSMAIGLPMALIGVVISFGAPKWLARHWRTPPGP